VKTSNLTFNLQEIPEGKSNRSIAVSKGEFEFDDDVSLQGADVEILFYKTDHFIQVKFDVISRIQLVCDRSLKKFTQNVEGSYSILFEPNPLEEYETDKDAVRQIPSDELTVSIEKEVRDTIMLRLPVRRIHPDFLDEDGIPTEFETKTFATSQTDEDVVDPRWEALKKLK
jgi:uncharacterized metal-binding protein YceD (DUF177 family)